MLMNKSNFAILAGVFTIGSLASLSGAAFADPTGHPTPHPTEHPTDHPTGHPTEHPTGHPENGDHHPAPHG